MDDHDKVSDMPSSTDKQGLKRRKTRALNFPVMYLKNKNFCGFTVYQYDAISGGKQIWYRLYRYRDMSWYFWLRDPTLLLIGRMSVIGSHLLWCDGNYYQESLRVKRRFQPIPHHTHRNVLACDASVAFGWKPRFIMRLLSFSLASLTGFASQFHL